MTFKTMNEFDYNNKTVLLRLDLNVPAKDHTVTDMTRINRAGQTVQALRDAGAKIVILSHFGRPKGEPYPPFSLKFLIPYLEESWGGPVAFAEDCIGDTANKAKATMQSGDILLLENVRFHKGEMDNDPAFVKDLAEGADFYINDAFSAAHRAHASTEGLAHILPSAAGLLMQQELNALQSALDAPQKPVMAIVGGSKISTKLNVLKNIIQKVDYLVLGGAMPNTFLAAQGIGIGSSLYEEDMMEQAKNIMEEAEKVNCEILLPRDAVGVSELKEGSDYQILSFSFFPDDKSAVDLGPESVALILQKIDQCKTLLWNGPLGVFEIKPFDTATNDIAKVVAKKTKAGELVSVAGGGDTVAALENAGVSEDLTYISSAGGAFLEWLEGKPLPGVDALMTVNKAA